MPEPARVLVCRDHETITEINKRPMTEATVTKKSKNPKALKLLPDELMGQLLARMQSRDAESILSESGLAG
ncbi:Transposase (plasmid) [Mycetohabitans rhizoxinica HKI 454]|uniref:Transposase n=1 Tax=Mycetohabitans rhizoxinica (strain DSM 19002 / CIP 109453 / HKI 454) TaxID=882378 RepID=E5AVR9_MYCRK|nr:Transposase [Mycetohabitans rhizoxinica HKI 454]